MVFSEQAVGMARVIMSDSGEENIPYTHPTPSIGRIVWVYRDMNPFPTAAIVTRIHEGPGFDGYMIGATVFPWCEPERWIAELKIGEAQKRTSPGMHWAWPPRV